jgi:hypothetical protein
MFTKLARFVLASWRGKQQSAIDCVSQAKGCRKVSPQIGDNHLLVYDSSLRASVSPVGRQGDIYDTIRESKCGSGLVKDEGRMRCVANRDCRNFFGVRFGIVCHDGTYRLWEWNEAKTAFVPFMLSSHK